MVRGEVEFVLVSLRDGTILAAAIGEHQKELDVVLLEQRQHPVIAAVIGPVGRKLPTRLMCERCGVVDRTINRWEKTGVIPQAGGSTVESIGTRRKPRGATTSAWLPRQRLIIRPTRPARRTRAGHERALDLTLNGLPFGSADVAFNQR
jgi:hypothetical protein